MFILLSCPGQLAVMGQLVLALRSSVPGTVCSLVAMGGTRLGFAFVKCSTQNKWLDFTSANNFLK